MCSVSPSIFFTEKKKTKQSSAKKNSITTRDSLAPLTSKAKMETASPDP